jgi:hypothetical protein
MPTIGALLDNLDERRIAQLIGIAHDEARMRFPLESNTVEDFSQFREIVSGYYNYHYTTCVSRGGSLSLSEAYGAVKELLERDYRKVRGNIVSAFNDAHDGTNGGLRVVLDKIAEALKATGVERYVTDVFDRHVVPNSWEQKIEIIRQFIAQCGPYLASSINVSQPERYAHDYSELIKSYVEGLQQTSSIFRRL